MIIEHYEVGLYCDADEKCLSQTVVCRSMLFPIKYCGKNRSECLRKARKDGWKVNKNKLDKDRCPYCTGKVKI